MNKFSFGSPSRLSLLLKGLGNRFKFSLDFSSSFFSQSLEISQIATQNTDMES